MVYKNFQTSKILNKTKTIKLNKKHTLQVQKKLYHKIKPQTILFGFIIENWLQKSYLHPTILKVLIN